MSQIEENTGEPASAMPSGATSLRSPEPQDASPPSVTPPLAESWHTAADEEDDPPLALEVVEDSEYQWVIFDGDHDPVAAVIGRTYSEVTARGNLVAAAPALLAALKAAFPILVRLAETQRQERGGKMEGPACNTAEYLAYCDARAALARADRSEQRSTS